MKRALFAATALAVAALALPAAQAAESNTTAKPRPSRTDFFERVDLNKDGVISKEEMVVYRHRRFTEIDANGDGTITREEFMAYSVRPKPASATSSDARKAKYFDRLDANKDGVISGEEWDQVAEKQFAALDADKDGKVTKEEIASARERFHHKRSGTTAPAKPGDGQAN
jgi:Ca2+-binding EF-hand superfamily protein